MSESEKDITMKVAAVVITLPRMFFDAFVLLKCWGWFIVPLGAVRIGYWHAFGLDTSLMLVVLPIVKVVMSYRKDDEDGAAKINTAIATWGAYGLVLAFGAFAHWMMGIPHV